MSDEKERLVHALRDGDMATFTAAAREANRRMSRVELTRKVRWEGGLLAALEYGIGADDIADPELAAEWRKMEDAFEVLRPLLRAMDHRLASQTREEGT